MSHDDDDVGFDLDAWEAPPPPAGIADAVIARVTAPPIAGAVEATPSRSSRWWIAGGIAAVVIGALSIALLARGGEELTGGSGAVATARPSHLELGGTALELEANTDVWWVRDGKRTHAGQTRGTATWKVAADEELVIDTGAMGASVVASGASLRVEVDMNLSDARLIGTSAVTAAAVALVTVIVYEGHVKVTSAEKTVELPAGTTVQVTPNRPPVVPDLVSGREQRLESQLKFLESENELLRKRLEPAPVTPSDVANFNAVMKTLAFKTCRFGSAETDFTLHVDIAPGNSIKLAFDAEFEPALADKIFDCVDTLIGKANLSSVKPGAYSYPVAFGDKPDPFQAAMRTIAPARFEACRQGWAAAEVMVTVVIEDGTAAVSFNEGVPASPPPMFGCVRELIEKTSFAAVAPGAYEYRVALGGRRTVSRPPVKPPTTVDPTPVDCPDAAELAALEREGDNAINRGSFAAALSAYDKIVKCKPRVAPKAYLAACKSRSWPRAKALFKLLNRDSLAQICLAQGFDPR